MLSIEEGQDYANVDEAELPYEHVQKLGQGNSGTVEHVKHRLTNKSYARKTFVVRRFRAHKDEVTKIFNNEVQIIRSLGNHRHIISVFATYCTKKDFGLILEPVASDGDLDAYLNEYCEIKNECGHSETLTKRLENMSSVLRRAFGCLAVGLAFIHEKKVRHKDIKPHNILLHNGLVVYADFGYSFDHSAISSSTTDGRPEFLTPRYSAPEVLKQEERNSSSDIFSLGCVFIEILSVLTATALHDDVTSFSASMDNVHEQLEALQTPPWSSSLATVVINMTIREPSKRFCATQVAQKILSDSESCCTDCAKTAPDPRSTPMEEQSRVGRAVTMESVSVLESIKGTDIVHAYKDAARPGVFTTTKSSELLSNLTGHVSSNDLALDACSTSGIVEKLQNYQATVEEAELYTNTGTMTTASLPSSLREESSVVSLDNHHASSDSTATVDSLTASSRRPSSSGDVDAQVCTNSRPRAQRYEVIPIPSTHNRTPWMWSNTHQNHYYVVFDQENNPTYHWYNARSHMDVQTPCNTVPPFSMRPSLAFPDVFPNQLGNPSYNLDLTTTPACNLVHSHDNSAGGFAPQLYSLQSKSRALLTSHDRPTSLTDLQGTKEEVPILPTRRTGSPEPDPHILEALNQLRKTATELKSVNAQSSTRVNYAAMKPEHKPFKPTYEIVPPVATMGIERPTSDTMAPVHTASRNHIEISKPFEGIRYEPMHSDYRIREEREANHFWKLGRVFSLLRAHTQHPVMVRNVTDNMAVSVVRLGNELFQVHRFIVVKVHCQESLVYACPIYIYDNRDVFWSGCNADEYAVVYFSGNESLAVYSAEELGTFKKPIAIVPTHPGIYNHSKSVLRLSRPIAIDCNTKVHDIGRVAWWDMPKFRSYMQEMEWEGFELDIEESRHAGAYKLTLPAPPPPLPPFIIRPTTTPKARL